MSGKLYIVATPIGNLADITIRAITVLKEVSLIAAEDTRQSRKLLQHYGINTPLYSLHAHNERTHSEKIIACLTKNEDVAYITDAGTPLISDPGAILVRLVRDHGFKVHPIPGPCAAISALSAAGFSDPHFHFQGFLPNKEGPRKQQLRELKDLAATLIFYEAPHRVVAVMQDLLEVLGNREVVIAREMTKKFETFLSGTITQVLAILRESEEQRLGEFVILVRGNYDKDKTDEEQIATTLNLLLTELPVKSAVSLASKLLGASKNKLYSLALKNKN